MTPKYSIKTITQTPVISTQKTQEILLEVYGIEKCDIFQLTGYDDLNFRVENVVFSDKCHEKLKNRGETKFFVKFTNPLESSNPYLLDGQLQLMTRLRKHGIPTAEVLPTVEGQLWKHVNMTDDVVLPIRLFTFLPGVMLESIGYSDSVYSMIGELVGSFHNATEDFSHDAYKGYCHFMCMENWDSLEEEFNFQVKSGILTDTNHIELCRQGIADLRSDVLDHRERFKSGLIHSDVNETNVLLDKGSEAEGDGPRITGLLDFGDTHHSLLIFDLAALVLYLMVDAKVEDWRRLAGCVLDGYSKKRKPADVEHVLVSMRARLVSSLVYALRTIRINYRDEDPSYILKMQASGWQVLDRLTAEYAQNKAFEYQPGCTFFV